jgi:hypothetical protein
MIFTMPRKKIEVEKRELTDALFWLKKAVDATYKDEDEVEEYMYYAIICLERAMGNGDEENT